PPRDRLQCHPIRRPEFVRSPHPTVSRSGHPCKANSDRLLLAQSKSNKFQAKKKDRATVRLSSLRDAGLSRACLNDPEARYERPGNGPRLIVQEGPRAIDKFDCRRRTQPRQPVTSGEEPRVH